MELWVLLTVTEELAACAQKLQTHILVITSVAADNLRLTGLGPDAPYRFPLMHSG